MQTITTSTYRTTYTLQQLINAAGIYQTKLSITLLLVELIEISGFDNNISNPATLAIVVDEIINQYPNLEIAELSISLREGITGKYGPTYNRIAIDTIGTWIKAYYEQSWPQIERKAVNRYLSKSNTTHDNTNAVPMPQWYKDKLAQLELASKKTITKPTTEKSTYQYISIQDYCHRHQLDLPTILAATKQQHPCPPGVTPDVYNLYIERIFLNNVNK